MLAIPCSLSSENVGRKVHLEAEGAVQPHALPTTRGAVGGVHGQIWQGARG